MIGKSSQSSIAGVFPRQMVLACIRKQTEQAVGASQPVAFLHGLCCSSCLQAPTFLVFLPWGPTMMDCDWEMKAKNLSSLQVFLDYGLYHRNKKQINTEAGFYTMIKEHSGFTLW